MTPARSAVYARFHDVGARLVRPSAAARDRDARFDRALWREVASTGVFALVDPRERAQAIEGLAAGALDLGFAVTAVAHLVFLEVIERFGSETQQRALLPGLVDGTLLGACANAEPGAGTDLMGLKARAIPSGPSVGGGGWTLHARKRSITNVGAADLALVSARIAGAPADKAVNVFVVGTAGPGRYTRARADLAGLRTSPTGTLLLRRAPVDEGALVGPLGSGLALFRFMFSSERLYTGHLYLAAIRACLARGLAHAEGRAQFGAPIGRNQYVQEKIVSMRVAEELLAAHLSSTHARMLAGEDVFGSLSVVKAYGVDAALDCAQSLVRLLGARGLSRDDEAAERVLRDLLGLSILGGTVELQKIVIYNETVRAWRSAPAPAPAPASALARSGSPDTTAGVGVRVVDVADADEPAIVALVARAFAGERELEGRWYYDTRPAFVLEARAADGALAGVRAVIDRAATLGTRAIRIAGIGIAVDPAHQRRGVGRALTERTLVELERRGFDLAVAFLFSRNSEALLRRAGFRALMARVTYLSRDTGALVVEAMPCFAKGIASAGLVDEIEARGELHLGVGTW